METSLRNQILINEFNIEDCEVKGESGIKNGRVDCVIYINKNYRLIVEAKIRHKEGEDTKADGSTKTQCEKYYEFFENKSKVDNKKNIYVFLTMTDAPAPSRNEFIHITYQDLMDHVLEPLSKHTRQMSDAAKINLYHYIDNLTSIKNNYTPLAMDEELKKLYSDFYKNHKELLVAIFKDFASDDSKERLEIPSQERDTTKYKLRYEYNGKMEIYKDGEKKKGAEKLPKRRVARAFAEIYMKLHPQTSFLELKDLFSEIRPDLVKNSEMKNTLEIGKTGLYILSNIWGEGVEYWNALKNLINKTQGITLEVCKKK